MNNRRFLCVYNSKRYASSLDDLKLRISWMNLWSFWNTVHKNINISVPFNDHISIVVLVIYHLCVYILILNSCDPAEVVNGPEVIKWKSWYCDSIANILLLPKSFKDVLGDGNMLAAINTSSNTPESCLEVDTKPTRKFLLNCIFCHLYGYYIFSP